MYTRCNPELLWLGVVQREAERSEIWMGRRAADHDSARLLPGGACAISRLVNDPARIGRAPARLDEQLVADLSKRPDFENVVRTIHEMGDFLLRSATAEFSVLSPTELHARGADGVVLAMTKLQFFHRLLVLRATELIQDAVRSINESHLVSFALATRALLETTAFAAYHFHRLAVPEDATALPEGYEERLRAAVFAGRFDWLKHFTDHAARLALIDAYDEDPRKQDPEVKAVNPMTALDALGERLKPQAAKARGIVHRDYALLSDMCHPSAGSQMIFFAGAEPSLRADLAPQRSILLGIAEQLLPSLALWAQTLVDVLADLEDLDERLRKMRAAASPVSPEEGGHA